MRGPYQLTKASIDQHVRRGVCGTYELLTSRNGSAEYTGRAHMDLNRRLKEHIGEGYSYFRFTAD